jgi:putative aminopeptidase FrvX
MIIFHPIRGGSMIISPRKFLGAAVWVLLAAPLSAAEVKPVLADLLPVPAVTGAEGDLAVRITRALPPALGVETDNLGAVFARLGEGRATLAVLAPMDDFGYVVSGFTPDGYLRLARGVPAPLALSDTFLLGRPVVVVTRSGILPAVVAQPSLHLLTPATRDQFSRPLTLEMIYVDIGAASEAEARAKGIEVLDPVTWRPAAATLAHDRWAGPGLGRRAACAALLAAALDLAGEPSVQADFAWLVQSRFLRRGGRSSLGALRAANRLPDRAALIVDAVSADRGPGGPLSGRSLVIVQSRDEETDLRRAVAEAAADKGIGLQYQTEQASPLLGPWTASGGQALMLALPVRYFGTPGELVDLRDVQALADLLAAVVEQGRVQ